MKPMVIVLAAVVLIGVAVQAQQSSTRPAAQTPVDQSTGHPDIPRDLDQAGHRRRRQAITASISCFPWRSYCPPSQPNFHRRWMRDWGPALSPSALRTRPASRTCTPEAATAGLARGIEPQARCGVGGFGASVDVNSSAMALVQSKDEVTFVRDGGSGGRRFTSTGRKHPAKLDPHAMAGHSVGHWEGDRLWCRPLALRPA